METTTCKIVPFLILCDLKIFRLTEGILFSMFQFLKDVFQAYRFSSLGFSALCDLFRKTLLSLIWVFSDVYIEREGFFEAVDHPSGYFFHSESLPKTTLIISIFFEL